MSWHSYNMNLSTTQGQNQEPFEKASNTMASITDNTSVFAELDPLFERLEAFTADDLLDTLSQEGPADDTYLLNPDSAPPTLSLPTAVGENNPDNFPSFNGGGNHPSNDSETSSSESPLLCPWPACPHRKPFSNKSTLKRHYYFLHVAPGSFPCDKCHSTFNRNDNLKQHLRSVHRE